MAWDVTQGAYGSLFVYSRIWSVTSTHTLNHTQAPRGNSPPYSPNSTWDAVTGGGTRVWAAPAVLSFLVSALDSGDSGDGDILESLWVLGGSFLITTIQDASTF